MVIIVTLTTYMVDTPASIAEESVKANKKVITRTITNRKNLQHCSPIRNANKTTGAVYWPSAL